MGGGCWLTTNFSVSSRQGFKLWGLSPWLPSLADPCLTLPELHNLHCHARPLPHSPVSSVRWCFPPSAQPRWPRLTQREPEPGAAANQFLSVRYSDAATSPATARPLADECFLGGMVGLIISCVNTSIQQPWGHGTHVQGVMGRFVVLSVNNN